MLAGTGEADWVDALHMTGAQVAGALEVSTPEAAAAVEYWYRHRTEIENIRAAEHGGALQHLPGHDLARNQNRGRRAVDSGCRKGYGLQPERAYTFLTGVSA